MYIKKYRDITAIKFKEILSAYAIHCDVIIEKRDLER